MPARPALGGAVPDALGLAELDSIVDAHGPHGVPVRGETKAPGGVDITVLVDDDLGVPLAANLRDPAVGGVLRRVRDGEAVDEFGVGGREGS